MTRDNALKLVVAGLAVAGGAVALFVLGARSAAAGSLAWYWDESEQRLYTAPVGAATPHAGIGGAPGDGWRATVYTCEGCADASSRRVAFFERMSDELRALADAEAQAAARGEPAPAQLQDKRWVAANTLVRAPDEEAWHPLTSEEGARVTAVLSRPCENGSYPRVCAPGE